MPAREDRNRAKGLNRDLVARTALDLIDAEGVGAATMRAIAGRLGVEAMSLYKHVRTRDELLDDVVELIVAELDDDPEVRRDASEGWRDYLTRLARGVRRYALAHPHAFPLVTTRPAEAPWINPPLRSLAWIESMLATLAAEGFSDEQVLFTYRSFNSFLLGYLLMESGARTLRDPQDGDGSMGSSDEPVPGGLTPTRTDEEQDAVAEATTTAEQIDPQGDIEVAEFPTVHRLADRLAEDRFDEEFQRGLERLLDAVAAQLD
ncbi:TetR/AcrR family transcriptional regulator C-terminal domain-containing protein [Aeromicrobium sp. Leaf350]|uniref:TetR/AcrR family transcriptional regulator C-terminal domain-containing protein n=1 Tax=Aeromicrobium sp. Leaf350 TaxID=2876565 RepID=UPI001E516917|nr:TetR/AcrR family transcriptional regulator C-terminal domain-containing protein [Aeromicrobium sp. Leaf350]